MNLSKKVISGLTMGMLFFTTITASANEYMVRYISEETGKVYFTAINTEGVQKDVFITVSKLQPNQYTNDGDYKVLKQIRVQSSGETQKVFTLPDDMKTGIYILSVSGENETFTTNIYHNNISDANALMSQFKGVMSESQLASAIEANKANIALDYNEYNTYKTDILKWLTLFKPAETIDFSAFSKAYYSALIMAKSNGKSKNEVMEILDILSLSAGVDYNEIKIYGSIIQEDICKYIANPNTTAASLGEYIVVQGILSDVYHSTTWNALEEKILDKYRTQIGIDDTKYKSLKYGENVFKAMLDIRYNSYKDMRNDFNNKVNLQAEKEKNGSGSSSGGSSGGGGVAPEKIVRELNIDNNIPKVLPTFKDVESGFWAKSYIDSLVSKGILNGVGNNEFLPNKSVTRAEFVKMIITTFFDNLQGISADFSDVGENDWYYNYVNAAYSAGILHGVGENRFAPNDTITREDMAVIINRTAEKKGIVLPSLKENTIFNDASQISAYAKQAVYKLYASGIIDGTANGVFSPKSQLTRAQAAKVIDVLISIR